MLKQEFLKDVNEWNNKGKALYKQSKFKEAIKCYDEALKLNPKDAYAWYEKGNALRKQGKLKEAIECYDKALKLDPKNVYAWNYKGNALEDQGKLKEAIECYDKALKLDPKFVTAWNNKGIALRKQDKLKEAVECFDEALKLDPKFVTVWNNKGIALKDQGKLEEAIVCYDKALKLNPKYIFALNNKALALDVFGMSDDAEKYYSIANKMDQNKTEEWVNMILKDNNIKKGKLFLSKYNKNATTGDLKQNMSTEKVIDKSTNDVSSDKNPQFDHIATRVMDVPNEPSIALGPIIGLLEEPLRSFQETLSSLQRLIVGIENFGFACTLFSKNHKKKQNLSDDEISSIYLYTCESNPREQSLYFILNKALREKDRKTLRPFFPYLRLLLHSMCKLPKCSPGNDVWRGVQKNFSSEYRKGDEITWWGFSSCTKDMNALDTFLGKDNDRTLFCVQVNSGVDISNFSSFPNEEEILVFPCVTFEVMNVFSPNKGLWIVQLKEKFSPLKLINQFDSLGE